MAAGDRSPSVRPSQTTLAVESPFPRPCRIRRRSRSACSVAAARRPCARCFRGRRHGEGEALPSGCAHRRVERRRKGSPRQGHPCLGESLALIGEGLARYLGTLEYQRLVLHRSMAAFIRGPGSGHMIALSEIDVRPAECVAATHQRTDGICRMLCDKPIHPGSAWQRRRCKVLGRRAGPGPAIVAVPARQARLAT